MGRISKGTGRGGARAGAGRKKHGKNRVTIERGSRLKEFSALLRAKVPDAQLIALLWEIAHGAVRKVLHPETGKPIEIRDAPDPATARYLCDRIAGKMPQPVSGDPSGPPVRVKLLVSSLGIPLDK